MNPTSDWITVSCCAVLGFTSSWLAIAATLRRFDQAAGPLRPGDFHNESRVPRVGGVALAVALVLTLLCVYGCGHFSAENSWLLGLVLGGALAMFALGLWDDLRGLGPRFKLVAQGAVAVALWLGGIRIEVVKAPFSGVEHDLGVLSLVATVAWLVGLTNLINLADGIDGLAGGIALMLMVLLADLGTGDGFSMLVAVGTAGALLAFLRFNYPPARIHLGDGGAYLLGFLIGALAILNSNKGTILSALVAPAFALALPIADAALTVLRRFLGGLPVFRPDRRHIHHRLLDLGFSRKRAVLVLHAISSLCLAVAFAVFWMQGRCLPLFAGMLFLILLCAGHFSGLTKNCLGSAGLLGQSLGNRRTIQSALVLSRWFELEAGRFQSEEELWNDYMFVVRKLGFAQVRLVSPGVSRVWREPAGGGTPVGGTLTLRHAIAAGAVLEFSAPRELAPETLVRLLAEIAAEAWHKAQARLPRPKVPRNPRPPSAALHGYHAAPEAVSYLPPEPSPL